MAGKGRDACVQEQDCLSDRFRVTITNSPPTGDQPVTAIDEYIVDDGLIRLSKKGLTGSSIDRYKSKLSAVFTSA